MPCYLVTDKNAQEGQPAERLVEANNQAAARNFVARNRFQVKQAEPQDYQRVIKAGGEIEVATGAAEVEEELVPTPELEKQPDGGEPEKSKK